MSTFLEILFNYLFIQLSILVFAAPFYVIYRYHHPEISSKHLGKNEHMEKFLSSAQANYLIFFWAAAEAICWFIIPEFLLLLIIFLRVKNKRKLLVYDLAGTFLGTIVGLLVSFSYTINLVAIPYITQHMIDQVHIWYQALGVFGLLFQPFSGIPYKVFVLSAHYFSINLVWFVLLAIIVRMARYYLLYIIFVGLYPFLHRFISKNYVPIFIFTCFAFSLIFLKVYHAYGSKYIADDRGVEIIEAFLKT